MPTASSYEAPVVQLLPSPIPGVPQHPHTPDYVVGKSGHCCQYATMYLATASQPQQPVSRACNNVYERDEDVLEPERELPLPDEEDADE